MVIRLVKFYFSERCLDALQLGAKEFHDDQNI